MSEYRKTFDPSFTLAGWWVRFIWGITFKPDRLRWHQSYGYHLLAIRLWGDPHSAKTARLVGIQWRRVDDVTAPR